MPMLQLPVEVFSKEQDTQAKVHYGYSQTHLDNQKKKRVE
jgi:hypothetical protein